MSDLPADVVHDENVEFPDQENIIMNIFTLCDIEKTGFVPVSKLIEFISPYIDFNSAHLEELRKSLDPLQQDSYVSSKVFYKSMKEWTDKFKNEFQANCTPTEITDPTSKRLSDVDQRQSTPTKNFAKGFFKGEYESGILNLSNISSYSYAGSTAGAFDPGVLQEQINELQYQNKKLNEMLSDVRVQLNVSEEQNGALQNDLERITKRLQAEQKVNEHLQKERKENDEYRENTNNIIKKYETLNQNLTLCKKENSQLKNQIVDFENEIQKLQEVVTKVRSNDAKKNQIIDELKIEIEIREKEITTLEECKRQLNQICKEKEDGIQQLIDETQHLKYEKIALENRLSEVINRSATSLQQEKRESSGKKRSFSNIPIKLRKDFPPQPLASTPLPFSPNIDAKKTQHFSFDSPVTRMINNKGTLNSPLLLKMLANPISPIRPICNATYRYSTSETVPCNDSSSEYLSPQLEGSKESYQTSENVSVIENTVVSLLSDDTDNVLLKSKNGVGISVNVDRENYIVCSLQSQNASAEKECQISPSSCEKFTQTPPRKLHMNSIGSPQRILSKSINEQQLSPIKPSRLTFSNPNMKFNLSISSPEPQNNPSPRMSKSLSPNVSSDDDYYWRSVLSTVHPYESLQSELMQVSTAAGCVGPCDHKMKQTQYEQEIESLQCELKQHESCQTMIEKYEQELKESKARMDKYENDIKALQTELDEAKSELTERNGEEKLLTETQEQLCEFKEKFTNVQQEKEREIAKLTQNEAELRKEYDSKAKELTDLKCEVRKFAEKVDNCKMELQRAMCDKVMYEEELKKAKEVSEIHAEQCRVASKSVEDMMKKIEINDKEKEEQEREKSELLNSNRNLMEQMTIYKENYLLAQQEISSLNEKYAKKKEEMDETKEQLVHLNEEFEKISSKYEENEKKLKEMQEAKKDEDKMYKDSYITAQEENLKLKTDRETLKVDLETKTKRLETLEIEYTAIKELNRANEKKLHEFNTQMENKLQKIHAEHELKMNEMISHQEKKMKHLDWLIVQKSGLEDSLDKYKMKYRDALENLSQTDELRTSYQNTVAQLKEKENEISKLEEDMEATMAQIDSLEAAQQNAEIKWKKQETEMNEKIAALEKEMSTMQQKLTSVELSNSCKNCSDLEIERKSATKTEPRRTTRVELLHHKIEKLDEQLDEEKNRTKTLAANLTKAQNEKNDLEKKLAEIENERKELLLQKDGGQMKIKKLTHSIQGLELKVNTYRNTIEDIGKQVEYRTKDMAQMEMRFSDLQLKSNKISHKHSLLVTHIGVVRQKIMDQKKILGGNTLYAVSVWRSLLENITPTSPVLKETPSGLVSTTIDSTTGPLDEEIHNLEQQINLTCILLKTLAKLRDQFQTPKGHGDGASTYMEKSAETGNESLLAAVVKRKFVLKPASFILRTNPLNTSPMSPDSPAAEMAEDSSPKEYASPRVELNNNDIQMDEVKLRSSVDKKSADDGNRKSFASDLTDSGSTSDSGSSESLGIEVVAKRYMDTKERLSAGDSKIENEKEVQEGLARQFRSMSEGAVVTHQLTHEGDVTVFPNLRDNVLETLGLLPDGQAKERLSEDEIEVKFQTLTLAFAIDAVTLADRRDRQRRQRDQAEDNIATEVAKLTSAIHRLNPLCVDAETTEMVTSLLSQLDVILQASNRISTSAEVFGSVQQEWRLAESVNVMLSHLRNLRQQRDTARRQLQCTKRMLQESTTTTEPTNPANRPRISSTNGRVVTRRRASIATITRPLESPSRSTGSNGCAAALVDGTVTRRVTTRRTSAAVCELSSRHWDSRIRQDWSPVDRPATLLRSRPSRLELGVDLVKIKEGPAESSTSESFEKYDSDAEFKTSTVISDDNQLQDEVILPEPTTLRGHIERKLQQFGAHIEGFWNYLVEQGTIHEICCLGAIICFALCTIIIGNLLLEVEYARRGLPIRTTSLTWLNLDEITKLFFGDFRTSEETPY